MNYLIKNFLYKIKAKPFSVLIFIKDQIVKKTDYLKTIFYISVLFGSSSQAQSVECRNAFSSPRSPSDFSEAMSKNLLLNKKQSYLLISYINSFFNAKEDYKEEIQKLFSTLEEYPELSKIPLREYQLVFFQKEEKKPESLIRFLKSFNSSAGRIRNNLFQIEANWGLWAKALSSAESNNINSNSTTSSSAQSNSKLNSKSNSNSKTPSNKMPDTAFESKDNSPSLSNAEKKALREEEKKKFMEYLETTPLNKELRQSILAKPKNSEENFSAYSEENFSAYSEENLKALDYREKIIAFYQALSALRENFQDDPKAFEFLSQAMSDLVHISGFGNPFYSELLKSKILSENIKGVHNILLERDTIAKELGFKKGFSELQSSLNIKHRDEFAEQLNTIQKEIENDSTLRKEILRLRPLSLQEAPFRGCLGNDCSTNQYFDLSLDPNYIYFTLTNKKHQSFGQVTVVLGQAKGKNDKSVKVAFVDKIQQIPNNKITAVLEGIRLSLKEKRYKLALPRYTGDHNGLSNNTKTTNFIEHEVLSNLTTELLEFNPRKNKYDFYEGFSRATRNLILLEFDSYKNKESIEIKPREIYLPTMVDKNLSIRSIYQSILSMKNSEKEEEQILFLKNLLMMNKLKALRISNKYVKDHLSSVIQNPNMSFKVRKMAFFTLIQFAEWNEIEISFFKSQLETFSEKERTLILGEMSNWKNSKESYKRSFISNLHFFTFYEGASALENLAHESPWKVLFDVNAVNSLTGHNMLQAAIINNNMELFQWLIKKGADVNRINKRVEKDNTINSFNEMALIYAIRYEQEKMVQELIKAGADINARDKNGSTAFMETVKGQHLSIAKKLISAGADLNIIDENGNSPLMIAVMNEDLNMVNLLIGIDKINLNTKNKYGDTVIILAIMYGQTKIVQKLISAGADINARDRDGNSPLTLSITYIQTKIAQELIRAGADLNTKDNEKKTPLMYALMRKHSILPIKLIQAGADINARDRDGNSILMYAVENGYLNVVQMLIKAKIKLNTKNIFGETPLMYAAKSKNSKIIRELIEAKANLNVKSGEGYIALMLAIMYGRIKTAEELILAGANLNIKDNGGKTPLMYALMNNYSILIRKLIQAGADINARDRDGNSILTYAVEEGVLSVVKMLIRAKVKLNTKDDSGRTPLILAIMYGQTKIAQELIKAGADLNVKNKNGYTALMSAIASGQIKIAQELIKAGADLNVKNKNGDTTLTFAKLYEIPDLVQLINEKMNFKDKTQ